MSLDRVFLDANVLFSAAYKADSNLAGLWTIPNLQLFTSAYAAEEARVNLMDRRHQLRLIELLQSVQLSMGLAALPPEVTLPEKDRPILQAAVYARASHLVTGDKRHFGEYFGRRIVGVLVLPPDDYLSLYR